MLVIDDLRDYSSKTIDGELASDAPDRHRQTACLNILAGTSHVHSDGLYERV